MNVKVPCGRVLSGAPVGFARKHNEGAKAARRVFARSEGAEGACALRGCFGAAGKGCVPCEPRKQLLFCVKNGIINADNVFRTDAVDLPHFANLPALPQIHED